MSFKVITRKSSSIQEEGRENPLKENKNGRLWSILLTGAVSLMIAGGAIALAHFHFHAWAWEGAAGGSGLSGAVALGLGIQHTRSKREVSSKALESSPPVVNNSSLPKRVVPKNPFKALSTEELQKKVEELKALCEHVKAFEQLVTLLSYKGSAQEIGRIRQTIRLLIPMLNTQKLEALSSEIAQMFDLQDQKEDLIKFFQSLSHAFLEEEKWKTNKENNTRLEEMMSNYFDECDEENKVPSIDKFEKEYTHETRQQFEVALNAKKQFKKDVETLYSNCTCSLSGKNQKFLEYQENFSSLSNEYAKAWTELVCRNQKKTNQESTKNVQTDQ